jgi:DNA-binding Lrp family transcriptional regulator
LPTRCSCRTPRASGMLRGASLADVSRSIVARKGLMETTLATGRSIDGIVYERPIPPTRRNTWYLLDELAAKRQDRRCVVSFAVIAREVGATRRRVIEAVNSLVKDDLIRVTRQMSPEYGWKASEFFVLPTNPRVRDKIDDVATMLGHDRFTVYDCILKYEALQRSPDVDWATITLRDFGGRINYPANTRDDHVGHLLDALKAVGFYDRAGKIEW